MDTTTYEETVVSLGVIGDAVKFLQDNLEVTGICIKNEVLKIILPTFIIAEITQTEPGFKGDTTKAGTKPATIDTGAQIQVPLFINIGDRVKIDTRSGAYVERMK
jgi:elongation factor P